MSLTTPQPTALIDAVHGRIERLQRTLAHGPHGDLTPLVAALAEHVDELAVALLGADARSTRGSRGLSACVDRLGHACALLEGALDERGLPEALARSIVGALEACADLAISAMERPRRAAARVA